MATITERLSNWTLWVPPVALVTLAVGLLTHPSSVVVMLVLAVVLVASVLAAVEHAETVAHKVGEPFGSLILAVAVTIIEVGLIVTLMLSGGKGVETLARDTVFAAIMITLNGIVGISLLVNAGQTDRAHFRASSSGEALSTIITLALLTMVVPKYTTAPGDTFSAAQLVFVAIASLTLYATYVSALTHTHRDYFLPMDSRGRIIDTDEDGHADPPTTRRAYISLGLLLVALVSVVGLTKVMSKSIERGVGALGLPHAFVGVLIALLVLLPETIAASRASRRDRVQTSMNLAYGSAMASIGLTIPVMAALSLFTDIQLSLGLSQLQLTLLAGTAVTSILTVAMGHATRIAGTVHVVLLAAFVFLAASP
ncbi:MAG TPA: ionic transporter y4hA [Propionibacteriaceae bacterium]|nr:ionic transporter y4hA [Propionibacteriaceae bacterium]